ncbi:DMT family transporter [Thalassotalea sp. PS06]|uniref:DMT family transporter n=1 Tax=Thalassotalea sp. PS06 TaxID=2594005 RepID=UPI001163F5A0|nr:DMT family transporter [Thalassotalea sp. PS06]QDP01873.1 EamA family transporter [Thalassotalea sp. PS06]
MNPRHLLELILLAAIWGGSFLLMRVSAPELGPVVLITLRTVIGFITLLPFLIHMNKQRQVRQHGWPIFVVGMTNTAIPFVLFAFATLTLSAGLTSVLNSTAPIFTAIIAYLWLKEKLNWYQALGLLLGFIGVLVLFASKGSLSFDSTALALFAALGATLLYGYAACFTKRYLKGVSAIAIAAGSQLFAALVLIPLAIPLWLEMGPYQEISNQTWIATIILGVVCTALAYILYFRLLEQLGPAKAISVTYLIPVFGIFWGMLLLDEQLTLWMVLGAGLILTGVGLTNKKSQSIGKS